MSPMEVGIRRRFSSLGKEVLRVASDPEGAHEGNQEIADCTEIEKWSFSHQNDSISWPCRLFECLRSDIWKQRCLWNTTHLIHITVLSSVTNLILSLYIPHCFYSPCPILSGSVVRRKLSTKRPHFLNAAMLIFYDPPFPVPFLTKSDINPKLASPTCPLVRLWQVQAVLGHLSWGFTHIFL